MTYPFKPGPPPMPRPPQQFGQPQPQQFGQPQPAEPEFEVVEGQGTGHPAVDEVVRSLENAAQLPPAEQIAEFEAAHQVLRETLASIDG